jgi:Uma2 family endonuclease
MVLAQLADRVRRLRRVEYEQMVELGMFHNERVELLRGYIVQMSPRKSRHAGAVQSLNHFFVLALVAPGRASVRVQLPLAVGDDSEPEPDIALVPPGEYRDHHPDTAFLVVEVAETSLLEDRAKAEIYASGGIPEYWIADTVHGLVEAHTDIVDGLYTRVTPYHHGQTLSPAAFPDLALRIEDILGRKP